MKIRLVQKGKSLTLSIKASNSGDEGVDLKEAVIAMGLKAAEQQPVKAITDLVETLAKLGYSGALTKETRNTKEFTITK